MRDDDVLLDGYLAHLRVERGLAQRSVEAYQGDLLRFALFVRQDLTKTFADIDAGDVAAWLVALSRDGISARAQARKLSALRGFYKFLVAERKVTSDPTALVTGPRLPRKLPQVLTFAEVEMLLAAPDAAARAAQSRPPYSWPTRCRPGPACSPRWARPWRSQRRWAAMLGASVRRGASP